MSRKCGSLDVSQPYGPSGFVTGITLLFYFTKSHTSQFPSLLSLLHVCLQSFSGNGFQRRTFPFLWVPQLSPCLSFSISRLTYSRLILLITPLHGLHRRHPYPLLLYPIVAMETCLLAEPLLSNGCCTTPYVAVVAQQRVYMPQYITYTQMAYQTLHFCKWRGVLNRAKLSIPRYLFLTVPFRIHAHITCMRKLKYRLVSLVLSPSTKFNRNPFSSVGAKIYVKREPHTRALRAKNYVRADVKETSF
jgi:hypothetical protein